MNTIEELEKLSDEQLRVKCAELCGWERIENRHFGRKWGKMDLRGWHEKFGSFMRLVPNYPGDLNAIAEAEKALADSELKAYQRAFLDVTGVEAFGLFDETDQILLTLPARQRCIAFIATKQATP